MLRREPVIAWTVPHLSVIFRSTTEDLFRIRILLLPCAFLTLKPAQILCHPLKEVTTILLSHFAPSQVVLGLPVRLLNLLITHPLLLRFVKQIAHAWHF